LAEVVAKVAALVRQDKYQDVEFAVGPAIASLPEVAAQRVVLLQVLGNVLVNALTSVTQMHGSPKRVAIDGRDLGEFIELTVTDNGEGISAERMPHLFKRGFTTRGEKGTGLGLHYSATSLNGMNGSIEAESPGPGQGATLRIRLPVATRKDKVA
jgi:C4-dicarboxylate-specific signal transduction histidine kinase